MLNYIREISTGFFVLIVAFNYSSFCIVATLLDVPQESNTFHIYSGVLATLVVILLFLSTRHIPNGMAITCLLLCAVITLLFFCTRFFYPEVNPYYNSYFLALIARFIPSVLTGILMLSIDDVLRKIGRALLPFILLYTLGLVYVVFTCDIGVNVSMYNTGFLTYQSISYFSSFAAGLSMYLLTWYDDSYPRFWKCILRALVITQILISLMGGGRGAFVLCCILALYFVWRQKTLNKKFSSVIFLLIILLVIYTLMLNNENLTMGYERIFNFFGNNDKIETDGRWYRWGLAWDAFVGSPIFGHGLGSVFYEVGFYSHNIFTDMLCEGGVILITIFAFFIAKFIPALRKLVIIDQRNEIMGLIFIFSFVQLCFSGYYLSESGIWVSLTYIICQNSLNSRLSL